MFRFQKRFRERPSAQPRAWPGVSCYRRMLQRNLDPSFEFQEEGGGDMEHAFDVVIHDANARPG